MATVMKFNNGKKFPVLGLGTWRASPGEVGQAVKDAIDIGYRHIDCAAIYGNEPEIGAALTQKIKEGAVTRDQLFITSKLWNNCHRPDLVLPALKKTLADLNLDRLDLYLIHWPFAFKEGEGVFPKGADGLVALSDVHFLDTWRQMEECQKLGLTDSIGVSNFNSQQLQQVLDIATIKPVTNQIECHAYLNQKKLIQFCKERNIVVTAYSPLANPSKDVAPGKVKLMDDPKLKAVAEKYGKSPAQVILRYLIQIGTNPIPKSVNKGRLQQNLQVFDFTLSPEDMAYIDSFNNNTRTCEFAEGKHAPLYPFNAEF